MRKGISKYKEGDILNGVKLLSRTWSKVSPSGKSKKLYGVFECPYCKGSFEYQVSHVKNSKVPKSCGCNKEHLKNKGLTDHKVRKIWAGIKKRCLNVSSDKYKFYGGRGITIQEDWVDNFMAFFDYVTSLPSYPGEEGLGMGKLTLDRIENDGNYEEGNLRWVTAKVQCNNRRNSIQNLK